jgi:hypothetical protein
MRLVAVVLACTLSACAFTNVPITLPTAGVSTNLSGGDGRQVVVVIPFADERQVRERCGMQKNGYNQDTASAICSGDPAAWIATLFAAELKAAGFSVLTADAAPSAGAVRLDGTLLKIFVEPIIGFTTISLETDLQVKLAASSKNGLLAERTFFVKGLTSGLVAVPGNFQTSVDDATRKIMKDMVAAVISLMNRYPQLGKGEPQGMSVKLALFVERDR